VQKEHLTEQDVLQRERGHLTAVLQGLLVAFLWSTSWVLIKIGLEDIPALTFAGLRYVLAFFCLLPFAFGAGRTRQTRVIRQLSRATWLRLIVYGLLLYTVTQGSQFLALSYLPAITTNLILSFSAAVVALLGMFLLAERPTLTQWGGLALYLIGVLVYFYPASLPAGQMIGIVVAIVCVLGNALSAILGRSINRSQELTPLTVTVVSMGIGAIALLVIGVSVQGFPRLNLLHWAMIAWLAVVNTAFAFTLWNHTLRSLSAMESSIINNTMMIQIPILALLFLNEQMTGREWVGLLLAGVGILIVQLRWQWKWRIRRSTVLKLDQ
jgi:drug/metabolite transporter (DMT)-like permease